MITLYVGHHIQQIDIFNPGCDQVNREKKNFPCPRSRHRIWSRERGSAFPFRVSPLNLHAQAKSGAYSRAPLFPPAFHHGVVSALEKRHRISFTQKLRFNGVITESPPAQGHWSHGSSSNIVVLPFQVIPLTNQCAPVLSYTHYLYNGHVRYRLCGYRWRQYQVRFKRAGSRVFTSYYVVTFLVTILAASWFI